MIELTFETQKQQATSTSTKAKLAIVHKIYKVKMLSLLMVQELSYVST